MKNKFLFLCFLALTIQVTAFSQQSSLTLTAGATIPRLWGKQWETKDGLLSFHVPHDGSHAFSANAGKQARQADVVDLYITNTTNAQIYIYMTDHTTGDVVLFEVYDPHIDTPAYITTKEAGYYDIEIGDYGPNTWKNASVGCESTKVGYLLTWTNAYLDGGCNSFSIY